MTVKAEDLEQYDQLSLEAMNTTFYFAVSKCNVPNWKEIMMGWVHYVEKEWSRFQKGNELARLNMSDIGEELTLSPPLLDCLQIAEVYRKKTGNLFSPYLLPQIRFHGYDESFPFQVSLKQTSTMPAIYHNEKSPFEFNLNKGTIKRITNAQVDLGGIGKGYTVQAAARWLSKHGKAESGIVDGGGDITVWSNGEKVWTIGVAHPFIDAKEIRLYHLKNGSIATSNIIYRSWKQGEIQKHHLLNGRTGLPVNNEVIQATVIAENCLDAEVSAKLCFMSDIHRIPSLVRRVSENPDYLLVTNEGNIISNRKER